MSAIELSIKLKRHKGGTWAVYITRPDGSWEHRRGLSWLQAERAVVETMLAVERSQENAA